MIKLSKKWSYALKSIVYIAERSKKLIKIIDISKDLSISESLLRRIISELEKSWILITTKGRLGWVKIWMELSDISVYDILNSVWEELGISECSKWLYCDKINHCNTTNLIWSIQKSFNGILKLQTLDKIISKLKK